MKNSLKKKKLKFKLIFNKSIPDRIESHVHFIGQIMRNLLYNAVKFTHFGKIEVKASVNKLTNTANQHKMVITVRDTGQGIEEKIIPILFDFFDSDEDNQLSVGSGINLSISKTMMDIMKGKIKVNSKINQGTEFILTIPIKIIENPHVK